MGIYVNNLALIKWCKNNELNDKNYFYNLFLKDTKKRKLKRDYLFDRWVELGNELKRNKKIAKQHLQIIIRDKKVYNSMRKNTGLTYDVIRNLLNRKHAIPIRVATFKRLIYVFDVLNHYINYCDLRHKTYAYKKIAGEKLGLSPRSIQKLSSDYPEIFIWINSGCNDVNCFVARYKKLLKQLGKDIHFLKNNIDRLDTKTKKDLFLFMYRENVNNILRLKLKYKRFHEVTELIDTVQFYIGRNSIKINIMSDVLRKILKENKNEQFDRYYKKIENKY